MNNILVKIHQYLYDVDRVIFNDPATIVFWKDGTKTIVKTMEGRTFNPYEGFCVATTKKMFGSNSAIKRIINEKSNANTLKKEAVK